MKYFLAVLLFFTLHLQNAPAQTPSEPTLQALLREMRLLRLALERSAVVAPKIQLTMNRMQIQQNSVTRAQQELEEIRDRLMKFTVDQAHTLSQIKDVEASALQEQEPVRRKALDSEAKELKSVIEQKRLDDLQLRTRESELVGRLRAEQAKLYELENRLNNLERLLDAPEAK